MPGRVFESDKNYVSSEEGSRDPSSGQLENRGFCIQ